MVDFIDPAYYISALAAVSTIVIGIIAIRNDMKKRSEEQKRYNENMMEEKTSKVISKIDEHMKVVDERFRLSEQSDSENKEDIEDVEDEVKEMTREFRSICDKLTKHEYVIDNVIPEFKVLKEDFYKFKSKIDQENIVFKNRKYDNDYGGSDDGNKQNIRKGRIQE